jgi:iduronate 2-sulfatase
MGYSIRTQLARYTEWRDWKTGDVTDRELYLASDQPAETRNESDNPEHSQLRDSLAELLRQSHPPTARDSN